jgi:hypothetical protein
MMSKIRREPLLDEAEYQAPNFSVVYINAGHFQVVIETNTDGSKVVVRTWEWDNEADMEKDAEPIHEITLRKEG